MRTSVLMIKVLYTCKHCLCVKQPLDVPARGEEDVRVWMEETLKHIATDHFMRMPNCTGRHVDIMIPVPQGTQKVGGPVEN